MDEEEEPTLPPRAHMPQPNKQQRTGKPAAAAINPAQEGALPPEPQAAVRTPLEPQAAVRKYST